MNNLQKKLTKLHACDPAIEWAGTQTTLKQAWENCPRGEWMLWFLAATKYDPTQHRLLGAWCARNTPLGDGRTTWDLLTDERSRHAIRVAENPESTREELRVAAAAAAAAAADDDAAAAAYAAAAYAAAAAAAAAAADAAAVAYVAYAAADAAAYVAYAAAAVAVAYADAAAVAAAYADAAAAADDATADARLSQANHIRTQVPLGVFLKLLRGVK
jgi:hypothetical protein